MPVNGPQLSREYRYIVIGGGSAGCLLAALLAKQQPDPVALLEAGPISDDVRTVVPNYYAKTFGSKLDWGHQTVPQVGLSGRTLAWPRGRLMGGSGAINALIYLQAAVADFAAWGLDGSQRPLGSTSEDWLATAPVAQPHPWSLAFLQSAAATGLRLDSNWQQSITNSCGLFQLLQRAGRRWHTGQLVTPENEQRENLTVLSGKQARKIIIRGGRASIVTIADADATATRSETQEIYATERVFLSGGTLGSPQLLLQSGVGPADELRDLGVEVQVDLPAVGKNLQDHLVCPVVFKARDSSGLPHRHSRAVRQQYRDTGTGDLASNIAEAGALACIDFGENTHRMRRSDIQCHFTPTHYLKYPFNATEPHFCSLAVTDLHPQSRGALTFVNTDTGLLQPRIDPGYLTRDADVVRLASAIAWARDIARQSPLRELVEAELTPGPKRTDGSSLSRWIRAMAMTIYHPVGTCRMQSDLVDDLWDTVVDRSGNVHGVDGLTICDASILPDLPSANTNAVTLWLADRCAMLQND